MKSSTKGVLFVMVSAVIFGLTPLFLKTAYEGGATPLSGAFYRFLLPILPQYIYLKWRKIPLKITGKEFQSVVLLSVLGYGGTGVLLFLSYQFIPSGMCTTIHFVYPVLVILGSKIFFKSKIHKLKYVCVFLSVMGIVLFYDGKGGSNFTGILIALMSGVTYTFYTLFLSKGTLQNMDVQKLLFYLNVVAAAMLLAICTATGEMTVELTWSAWISLILGSALITFVAATGYQMGVKLIGPESTAILSTLEPITSVIVGVVVYNEAFGIKTLAGCVLIIFAAIMVSTIREKGRHELGK